MTYQVWEILLKGRISPFAWAHINYDKENWITGCDVMSALSRIAQEERLKVANAN